MFTRLTFNKFDFLNLVQIDFLAKSDFLNIAISDFFYFAKLNFFDLVKFATVDRFLIFFTIPLLLTSLPILGIS